MSMGQQGRILSGNPLFQGTATETVSIRSYREENIPTVYIMAYNGA